MLSCIRVSIPKHPGLREQEEVLRDSSQPFFLSLYLFILASNNSHCLLSAWMCSEEAYMSDCSHQMDSWMQQADGKATLSDAACFGMGCLSFQVHYHHPNTEWCVVWGWGGSGVGESLTCIPRGIITSQLLLLPAPYLEQLGYFYTVACERVC